MSSPLVIVRTVDVPVGGASPDLNGVRIAHVSDFHFRCWNQVLEAAQNLLLTLKYDFLVATGDFCAAPRRWPQAVSLLRKFFEPVAARAPAYAVLGNHDDARLATATDMPVVFLRNQAVFIKCSRAVVELIGVDQGIPRTEDFDAAFRDTRTRDLTILLAHYPSTVYRLPTGRVDLQLSGHTHGGQIRFPWVGCIWAHDGIATRMARGLHAVAGTLMHVSPGIGLSPPISIRINCPPEVTLLVLRSTDPRRPSSSAKEPTSRPSPIPKSASQA